ncbi:MAG: DMT family transporter [Desulfobacteraceae bacterium]|nr:DMT family transporter [Desulfobacteraceae bacterium]
MIPAYMLVLAFFNGLLIVTTRIINAKLGLHVSGVGSAVWNHFIGFLFLALLMPFHAIGAPLDIGGVPLYLFLGGFIGAGYVALNSWVMPKIGATTATVLLIAGQIILGTIIDAVNGKISNLYTTTIGIALLVSGIWIGGHKKAPASAVQT